MERAEGSNRKEDEEDPGKKGDEKRHRESHGGFDRVGRGERAKVTEARGDGWARGGGRHIYLTCDATASEFH